MWEIFAGIEFIEWLTAGGVGVAAVGAGAALTANRRSKKKDIKDKAEKAAQEQATIESAPKPVTAPTIVGDAVIGREAELAALHASLIGDKNVQLTNDPKRTALTGHGGIGKTTLARYYIETHGAEYDGVLWVDADTRQKIIDGLMDLCVDLEVQRPDAATEGHAKDVLRLLQRNGQRYLIVYDNVEDRADIQDLIPQGSALIVTTRQGEGWPGFTTQSTDVLDWDGPDSAAVKLLIGLTGQEDPEGAEKLAEALGGLPLALTMAGRLIAKEGQGFAAYLTDVARIIAAQPKNANYPDSVIGAVKLSYEKLSDDAKLVADLFAWWAPEGLQAELITGAPSGSQWGPDQVLTEDLINLVKSPERVAKAIDALEDRSLLRRGAGVFDMHRMSSAALRAMQGEDPLNDAAAALLAAVYPGNQEPAFSGNWPECRRLTPHTRAMMGHMPLPEIAAMDFLLNQASVFAGETGDFSGEVDFARASLDLKKARLPESDRDVAVGHANLGIALRRAGDLDAAEAEHRRAVELGKEYHAGSIDLAASHNLLGGFYRDKARAGEPAALKDALKEYQSAAAIYRQTVPRKSDAYAAILNNLAAARSQNGQRDAALRFYQASLNIRRAVLPQGDLRLSYGLKNVGSLALRNGAADQAEEMLEECLALERSHYIDNTQHPEMRTTAGWLISTYLTRARARENAGMREAKAKKLCAEFGYNFDQEVEMAKQYPYTPKPRD